MGTSSSNFSDYYLDNFKDIELVLEKLDDLVNVTASESVSTMLDIRL
jgi:hypothetical protein